MKIVSEDYDQTEVEINWDSIMDGKMSSDKYSCLSVPYYSETLKSTISNLCSRIAENKGWIYYDKDATECDLLFDVSPEAMNFSPLLAITIKPKRYTKEEQDDILQNHSRSEWWEIGSDADNFAIQQIWKDIFQESDAYYLKKQKENPEIFYIELRTDEIDNLLCVFLLKMQNDLKKFI